jgi:hypothetical protein
VSLSQPLPPWVVHPAWSLLRGPEFVLDAMIHDAYLGAHTSGRSYPPAVGEATTALLASRPYA